jgi:hypothetical protein
MNIHPVNSPKNDANKYCGPAAISILTGMTTGEAARLLRQVSGKTLIKGTHAWQVLQALYRCGLTSRRMPAKVTCKEVTRKANFLCRGGTYTVTKGEWTLAQWLKKTVTQRTAGRVFLVAAGHHWLIITGRRYCCGITKEIVSITDDKVKRRARVTEVYEIMPMAGKTISIPERAKKPKPKADPYRTALKKFEKANDLPSGKLESSGGFKDYVIPECDHFPEGFSTMHHDWCDTLSRLEKCFEHPSLLDDGGHYSE